jgi:hypothetical protein
VILAGCAQEPPTPTEPVIEVTTFPSKFSIDDMDIEFSGYEWDAETLNIQICYDPPTDQNWYFDDIVLKVDNQEFTRESVSSNTTTGRADGFQCGTIGYYPHDLVIPAGKAELFIGRLGVFAGVDKQNCDDIQKNLDKLQDGFVITCDPAIVGRDSGFVILEKPESMSEDEATLFAIGVSSYSDIIPLDWRFSFTLEKP